MNNYKFGSNREWFKRDLSETDPDDLMNSAETTMSYNNTYINPMQVDNSKNNLKNKKTVRMRYRKATADSPFIETNTNNGKVDESSAPLAINDSILYYDEQARLFKCDELLDESLPQYTNNYGYIRQRYIETVLAISDAKKNDENKREPDENSGLLEDYYDNDTTRINIEGLKLPQREEVLAKHSLQIERIMEMDKRNSSISIREFDFIKTNYVQIHELLDRMGYSVISYIETVAFLNLPRAGDNHIGKGVLFLTKKKIPENTDKSVKHSYPKDKIGFYLHFVEYHVLASMMSKTKEEREQTFYKIVNQSSTRTKLVFENSDDVHRVSEGVFATISTQSVISAHHFFKSSTRTMH